MNQNKKAKTIIIFLTILLFFSLSTFLFAIIEPLLFQPIPLNTILYSAGKLTGLAGFLLLGSLILSGETAKYFDKFFGLDKIIKFQRKFSLITTIIIISHPIFFILSSPAYSSYLIPDTTAIPMALGTTALYLLLVIMAASKIYKLISYKSWQYLHSLNYLLFFFALYHALNLGTETSDPAIKTVFFFLAGGIILGAIYRMRYKLIQRKFKSKIKKITWENYNTFSIEIKTNKKMGFKPGQFCFLRIEKKGLFARHPFTISSPPQQDTLNFTIKLAGRFTKTAAGLKKGDEIIVEGPFGTFTINDKEKKLIFIAGGVGITPFRSMIKSLNYQNKQQITLFYFCRTKKDILFKKELDTAKRKNLKIIYAISRENPANGSRIEHGRINKKMLQKHAPEIHFSDIYICGPDGMKRETLKILKEIGVENKDIYKEDFFW